jgi:hypothetical protein
MRNGLVIGSVGVAFLKENSVDVVKSIDLYCFDRSLFYLSLEGDLF